VGYTCQYYDLVLLGVFASMIVGAVVGLVSALSMSLSVTGAGFVSAARIGHGLFVKGPVDEPSDLADEVDSLDELTDEVELL
jgi:hypothetical protein